MQGGLMETDKKSYKVDIARQKREAWKAKKKMAWMMYLCKVNDDCKKQKKFGGSLTPLKRLNH